jgi:hypothetical protein
MTDDHLEDMTNARSVLIGMRHNLAKTIAAGYKRGETEAAIKSLTEVQEAIDVLDFAILELEELEEQDDEDDE